MAAPRKSRKPKTYLAAERKAAHEASALLLHVSDLVKPQNLDALRRVCAMTAEQRLVLRQIEANIEGPYVEQYADRVLQAPKMSAELVAHLLRALDMSAANDGPVVEYTSDPAFGPAQRPDKAPGATRRSLIVCRPGERGECDDFVRELVLRLTDFFAADPSESRHRQILTVLAKPDEPGREHAYTSDEPRSNTRLVLIPNRTGFRVLVRDDEPCVLDIARNTPDEAEPTTEQTLVESLYAASGIKAGGCMRIVPNEFGWAISEVDAEPSVTISSSIAQTDVVSTVRDLYAAMNNDTLEPRPIDLTTEQAVMVHGNHGPKAGTFAEDIGDTLDTIEGLIDRLPGDPGPTCRLARRIEDVLKELQRRAES